MTKKKNILKAIGIYSFIAMMFVIILYPLLWTFGISLIRVRTCMVPK